MTPAIFLDRDGTIIELVHHLTDPADVKLIAGAGEAIARINAAKVPVIIITNQSVIGRGKLTFEGLEMVHAEMNRQLAESGAHIDAIYACPLAPTQKDPTVIEHPERKPGPDMLIRAAADHDLDLSRSVMVGDTVSDMLAGRNAGVGATILVRTGYGDRFEHARDSIDHEAADLAAITDQILTLTKNEDA